MSDTSVTFAQQTFHLGYQVIEGIDLNLVVPRVEIERKENGLPDIDLEGLGDITFFLNWKPWRGRGSTVSEENSRSILSLAGLSFIAGVEMPTGEDEETPLLGVTTPSLLQRGSGTVDPIVGFRYGEWKGNWLLFHQTTAVFPVGESGAGLAPGEYLETSTGVGYQMLERVIPSISLDGIVRGRDELNGLPISNTGASLLFINPSVSVRVWEKISIEGSVRVPVYRKFQSTQVSPGVLWKIGASWAF